MDGIKSCITVLHVFSHFFVLDRKSGLEVRFFKGSVNSSARLYTQAQSEDQFEKLEGYLALQ